jgi:hypothetical protein
MGKRTGLCRSAKGLFVRNLGWKMTPDGKYVQHKFYLGRDEQRAQYANLRLEQLWEQACKRWSRENARELQPLSQPMWNETTLEIAEAIRNGELVAFVSLPRPVMSVMIPESPLIGHWLFELREDITVIKIELSDVESRSHSDEFQQRQGQMFLERGRRLLTSRFGGETLHGAFAAYCRWIDDTYIDVQKKPTLWSGMQKRQVNFLKTHLSDRPLATLDALEVERLIEILRNRPLTGDGKPVSVSWTRNCIKQLRHFLRWLNKAPEFAWKRPADLEIAQVRIPTTPAEKAATMRSSQVQTYSVQELRILWEHASPLQRLQMLLALNCGFGRAEISSLEAVDVHLHARHPHEQELGIESSDSDSWILRVRNKTGVYGEFKLWPATVRAIEWWKTQRIAISPPANVTALLVNRKGNPFDTTTKGNNANFQIPSAWFQLSKRIRKDHPEFRQLSFNKLRKTAGNLIRKEAGGEFAGVFLCHGRAVKSDELLDLYTNRPFAKVFAAISAVGGKLETIWETVENPFPEGHKKQKEGIPLIGRCQVRRIQDLKKQGYKTSRIAEMVGVSHGTVLRWARKVKMKPSSDESVAVE